MLTSTVVGSYPKISSRDFGPNLRQAFHQFDRKEIGITELDQVQRATIARVVREQEEAGIDVVTDGQIRWDDLLTPFARNMAGFEIGGLIRFFDNNVYFRRPIVTGPVAFRAPTCVEDFRYASSLTRREVKPVIVGPFTLAALSQDTFYHDREKLTLDLAAALHQEAVALEEAGTRRIQVDEPALLQHPDQGDLVREALRVVTSGLRAEVILQVYFGSIEPLLPALSSFPVSALGVDCTTVPRNLDLLLQDGCPQNLIVGCVEARNTRREKQEDLLRLFDRVARRIPPERFQVSPSCGLEFLPHDRALQKLSDLAAAVRAFNGQV